MTGTPGPVSKGLATASGGGEISSPQAGPGSAMEAARRLCASERLRERQLEMLPLSGPGAPWADVQGRQPGPSTTPEDLAELISSIASVGVLQPILVERLPGAELRLVAGERRLRAARWGAVNLPPSPHFEAIPALVCPGPLPEEERRIWQIAENLVRSDLGAGELAAALLFERCAVLTTRLVAAGATIPTDALALDEPLERFRALERVRLEAHLHHVGAPWEDVLARLGIQMGPDTARQLYRAFASLPAEVSAQMDAAGIALATRLAYLRLDRGCQGSARELWEAARLRGRPDLLAGAMAQRATRAGLSPPAALDAAERSRAGANRARARALGSEEVAELADPATVAAALSVLRDLVAQLRHGKGLSIYDEGTIRLCAQEILAQLPAEQLGKEPRREVG